MLTPPPTVPMPASNFTKLRGRRAIVGMPGVGFRGDLRADDVVIQGGRAFVPILSEQDYYRAETEQVEVFAPLIPIYRVWIEYHPLVATDIPHAPTIDAPPRRDAGWGSWGWRGSRSACEAIEKMIRDCSPVCQSSIGSEQLQ